MNLAKILRLFVFVVLFQGFAHAANRPNIVFLFSDDHAYQAISAYNDARKLINTPNIDRIAKEGMKFNRCLVTNSICGPSRAVILTGKYSHLNGFYNNTNSRFDGAQTTFPKLMQGRRLSDRDDWQMAPRKRPDGLRFLADFARSRRLLQPSND